MLNHWFIVGKTAVKQCKYYVTLTQKAFALPLTKTCKHWLSLERLTDFEWLRSVKLTDAVESIPFKYQPNKFFCMRYFSKTKRKKKKKKKKIRDREWKEK